MICHSEPVEESNIKFIKQNYHSEFVSESDKLSR